MRELTIDELDVVAGGHLQDSLSGYGAEPGNFGADWIWDHIYPDPPPQQYYEEPVQLGPPPVDYMPDTNHAPIVLPPWPGDAPTVQP